MLAGFITKRFRFWDPAVRRWTIGIRRVACAARGLVDLRPLISARYPLAKLNEALDRAVQGPGYRVIVNP